MSAGRALALVLVALLLASPAAARDRGEVLLLRARTLAGEGRCADALPVLEQAKAAAPNDARVALLTGRCLIDQRRNADALAELDRARSLDPSLRDVDLYRAVALYQLGDMTAAWSAIQAAEGRSSNEALYQLYLGLLLLQRQETREATLALERARRADPNAVEPVASFYSVLAWRSLDEQRRAEEALARVEALDPGGPWAEQARRALETARRDGADRRWWANATAGVEWDSNVALFGTGVTPPGDVLGANGLPLAPGEISRREDVRAVFSVEVGTELLRTENWTVGALGTFDSRVHGKLNEFDTDYPGASLWVDRRIDPDTLLRVRYDTTYGWADWQPLVYSNGARAQLFHAWGAAGETELTVGGSYNDFFITDDTTIGPQNRVNGRSRRLNLDRARDRDGTALRAGITHVVPLGFRDAALRGGYFYNRYWSEGREWDYQAHEVHLGAAVVLPFELVLSGDGAFTYAPYDHASTYPDPPALLLSGSPPNQRSRLVFETGERRDTQWRLTAGLERAIGDHVILSARYTYVDNESNVDVFNYDQEIVGGYVTVRFP